MQGDPVNFGVRHDLFDNSFGHALQGPKWYIS